MKIDQLRKFPMTKTRLKGPACNHLTQLELSLVSLFSMIYKDKLLQHISQQTNRCLQARFHLPKKNRIFLISSRHIIDIDDYGCKGKKNERLNMSLTTT